MVCVTYVVTSDSWPREYKGAERRVGHYRQLNGGTLRADMAPKALQKADVSMKDDLK